MTVASSFQLPASSFQLPARLEEIFGWPLAAGNWQLEADEEAPNG
jgi:hypothetical protein